VTRLVCAQESDVSPCSLCYVAWSIQDRPYTQA